MAERDEKWSLHRGEAWEWLRSLPSSSADALVTDPPYSSGGFTRGDRMADPSAKYRASGAAEIISFAGCELSEHYHALASRRLHAEAAGADGTAAALGGQLALGGAP